MTAPLVISAVCLVFEAFFSGSEIAVVSADRLKIRQGADLGHGARRLLQSFLAAPQRLLATTLVGTQICIVLSSVQLTLALAHRVGIGHAELMVLACLTPVLVVLGEIVPKSIAQQYADKIAPRVAYPLHAASILFWPVSLAMMKFTAWVSRKLGVEAPRKLVSREDLEAVMQGPGRSSEITEGERTMISRIFDFGELRADDIMVPLSSVLAIEDTATIHEAVHATEQARYTRYPIYHERVDRVVGILHAFDLLKAQREAKTVAELMRPVLYAPLNQPVVELLVSLQRQRAGMAIVVDEYGGAVGVVTIEDILEEIVGEIEDEYDVEAPKVRREAEGVWRVRARTSVEEINRELRLGLPESEDYETLGGLLLDKLKHIPRQGETLKLGNLVLTVTAASERAVEEVQIKATRKR